MTINRHEFVEEVEKQMHSMLLGSDTVIAKTHNDALYTMLYTMESILLNMEFDENRKKLEV